jgi:hypothetical protein
MLSSRAASTHALFRAGRYASRPPPLSRWPGLPGAAAWPAGLQAAENKRARPENRPLIAR